jgi:hypothetical protein
MAGIRDNTITRKENKMVQTAARQKTKAERGRGFMFAMKELGQVLWAWVTGEGNLIGLLKAWHEVVTGKVRTE